MSPRQLAVLGLIALASSFSACGRASSTGVAAGIKQLASISAEGALMADDVARRRSKVTFVRVHGAELSAQAEHEAEKLSDHPVAPKLKQPIQTAIELSADISGAIDDLRVSPRDREQARESQRKLLHWAKEAGTLADSL
jgi:queuine/archaeosine tRNA-ribosyltransferase